MNNPAKKEFKERLDTAVFTTKFVLEENQTITYVTHHTEDGAWQFFSADEFEDYGNIAKVVGLGEIIDIDDTVLDLADMPVGYYAFRESAKDNWIIQKQEE